ncbi:MAG TPA: thioredoxin family protein [Polyangiaceae bacterium]|nr:thioredoxin family protein [Polyangiaceae bacterium]
MAASSTMLELGTSLPPFSLPDTVSGRIVESGSLSGAPLIVAFVCNHCPYVKHVQAELVALGRDAAEKGVQMVAISSNDVSSHPEDGPGPMAVEARKAGYPFPYLYDETQDVAKAFRAACTPELYLFDADGRLAYRGRLDDSTPKNGRKVTGKDARAALDAVSRGERPSAEQHPSIGCSIKWKAGNEPGW